MKQKWLHGSVLAIGLFLLSPMASAAVIGTFRFNGGPNGNVRVSSTLIDFMPPQNNAGGGDGTIQNTDGTSLQYGAGLFLPAGALGRIQDIPGMTMGFISFAPIPVFFDLVGLGPGTGNAACTNVNFASCSVTATSPFVLTRIGNDTTVTLPVFGTARDNTSVPSVFTGSITTQIPNTLPSQIQTSILAGNFITSSYSGEFVVTAIPEPGTVSMLLLGGALLVARRFRKKVV